jgi:hypothetical protein
MTSKWTSNTKATDRVKTLLEQAGIPLELEVSGICSEFCASHLDAKISSDRIIYSTADRMDTYREVDQNVQIYEEFEVNDFTKVQFIANISIECKYRKDIEVFAFPLTKGDYFRRFPVHSNFCGSAFFRILRNAYSSCSELPLANIVLIEVENGQTPKKVHSENLIHKAAGALYDYIKFDLSPEERIELTYSDRLVDELGLLKEFEVYLSEKRYFWKSALNNWISSLPERKCSLFRESYYGGDPPYHSLCTHLPVVCVNGPLYCTKWSAQNKIETFHEIPFCFTVIRKHGWPGLAYSGLMTRSPEVPAIVTNARNLHKVLEIGFNWYKEIYEGLIGAQKKVLDRWPIEACVFQRVMRHFHQKETESGYRSDLDRENI